MQNADIPTFLFVNRRSVYSVLTRLVVPCMSIIIFERLQHSLSVLFRLLCTCAYTLYPAFCVMTQ